MKCAEYREQVRERARIGLPVLDGHAASCSVCARWLEDQVALTAAERQLKAETVMMTVPVQIEANLVAEFHRAHHSRNLRPLWFWVPAAAACAAAIAGIWLLPPKAIAPAPRAIAVSTVQPPPPQPQGNPAPIRTLPKRRAARKAAAAAPAPDPEMPFIQIPYTLPLSPYERAAVVRMEMPVSALIAAGVPVETPDTAARAQADVIVGDDGRARAFRLISISAVDTDRSIHR